ncbi:MAG: GNAT family N-acetyltransferase [Actinobacteria bacterium]|nr:MAG: GNAT family N-acetyltransferase [Actinomycetota bacterium]
MIEARRATPDDAPELVRLRGVMYASFDGDQPPPRPWQDAAERYLRTHLVAPDDSLAAFVVARPGGLASCAVGSIEYRLAGPNNPSGMTGYVFNVATDPDARRRGYGRACMVGLLDWYRRRGVTKVDLRASPDGEPLYASLGFVRSADPAMRLLLTA